MSIYRFDESSAIKEVSIHRSKGGGIRAYATVSENANPAELAKIRNLLVERDMQCLPIKSWGENSLEIRGFKKEDQILHLFKQHNSTLGKPTIKHTKDDSISLWDKVKKNTLKACGWMYLIGDLGWAKYTWDEAFDANGKFTTPQGLVSALFYAAGSQVVGWFGKGDKSDFQLKELSYKLMGDLNKEGISVSKDAAIRAIAEGHNEGVGKRILNFFERYPAEITNSMFAVAGSMIFWTSAKDLLKGDSAHSKNSILLDMGLGAMTVLAGIVSVFIKEEAPDPNAPRKTGLAGLWQKVKEKPLRVAGGALMVSTVSHGFSTIDDWKSATSTLKTATSGSDDFKEALKLKNSLPGRATFVTTNLIAEGLMAVSSKGHGKGVKSDRSLDYSLQALAADIVHNSEDDMKEVLIKYLSTLLTSKRYIVGDKDAMEKGIREQLEAMPENRWATIQDQQASAKELGIEQLAETPTRTKTPPTTNWAGSRFTQQQPVTAGIF
jgi:hypothetical protein